MARVPPMIGEKPLYWVASSKHDFLAFPAPVRTVMTYALGLVQLGGKHPHAKLWKREGPAVYEAVENFDRHTYRTVYTVRFEGTIYVLHAFRNESPSAIRAAAADVEFIHECLKRAREDYETTLGIRSKKGNDMASRVSDGSTNVFADLGLTDALERQTKTRLAMKLNELLDERSLKQLEAASVLGVPQPKVSALANYRLDGFSVEKLMQFLTLLNQDVEKFVRSFRDATSPG